MIDATTQRQKLGNLLKLWTQLNSLIYNPEDSSIQSNQGVQTKLRVNKY